MARAVYIINKKNPTACESQHATMPNAEESAIGGLDSTVSSEVSHWFEAEPVFFLPFLFSSFHIGAEAPAFERERETNRQREKERAF